MSQSNHIGRVAEILHLPPSTLRYWDRCGLLRFDRDPENRYRRFSAQTVIDICDVALYREMGIPVRTIRDLPTATPRQLGEVLDRSETELTEQLKALQNRLERLRVKQEMLRRLDRLEHTTEIVTEALPGMSAEDFGSEQTIQAYLSDSYRSTAFLSAREPGRLRCGIILPPGSAGTVLRPADSAPRRYLKGLLRVVAAAPQENNAARLRAAAEALGFHSGDIVGRYLITACEDRRYDFYEAWTELLP